MGRVATTVTFAAPTIASIVAGMTRPHWLFHAVLFPHRSLSRRGFMVVMGGVALILGFGAARFWAIGAWPVALFALLDVVLLYVAFRLSYRSAREFEEVGVSEREVMVRKVTSSGKVKEHRFNPAWTRLAITRRDEEGVVRLDLGSHGKWVVVGAFLNPPDRESFAHAFSNALDDARNPA